MNIRLLDDDAAGDSGGVQWITGTHLPTGNAFIALSDGQRIDIDPRLLAGICAALGELAVADTNERCEVMWAWNPDLSPLSGLAQQ